MITVSETRELLGNTSAGLSDEEVEVRRDYVYALAENFLDTYLNGRESDTPRE